MSLNMHLAVSDPKIKKSQYYYSKMMQKEHVSGWVRKKRKKKIKDNPEYIKAIMEDVEDPLNK